MHRNTFVPWLVLLLIQSSCTSQQPTAAVSPLNIQQTAEAMAFTFVAQTQAVIPSATISPTQSQPPTDTASASPTLEGSPTSTATLTPQPSISDQEQCKKTLTAWEGPTANFKTVYEYTPRAKNDKVVLSFWVSTKFGECGFLADLSSGPVGQYTAAAFIDGKKNFKVFGGFSISEGNWTIIVRNESIVAQGGCYPHC